MPTYLLPPALGLQQPQHQRHSYHRVSHWTTHFTTTLLLVLLLIVVRMESSVATTTPSPSTPPPAASLVVTKAIDSIQHDIIGTDAGDRGMKPLIVPGDLLQAAQCLAYLPPASMVVIVSGFPCCINESPPTETDGPPGTFAIARAAYALGHQVIVVTDKSNQAVFEAALTDLVVPSAAASTSFAPLLTLQIFPAVLNQEDEDRLSKLAQDCTLLIACERAGPGKDGNCYTMRGINMTEKGLIAPLHRLAMEKKGLTKFLAVGDGGNELGMGKVLPQILNNPKIAKGDQIGCVVPADHLIAASVSNWGGYALAAATALIKADSIGRQEVQEQDETDATTAMGLDALLVKQWLDWCLPTDIEEVALLNRCVAAGCRDGVSGKMEATVDGMPLERSLQCLRDIRSTALLAGSQAGQSK